MSRDYRRFYAMCKAFDKTKEEIVYDFTDGETTKCSDLTDEQFQVLFDQMIALQAGTFVPAPGDLQRKKMIGLARTMHWGRTTSEIIEALDNWCLKQKFKKRLNDLTVSELGTLLTIFESKVYAGFLKGLKK